MGQPMRTLNLNQQTVSDAWRNDQASCNCCGDTKLVSHFVKGTLEMFPTRQGENSIEVDWLWGICLDCKDDNWKHHYFGCGHERAHRTF